MSVFVTVRTVWMRARARAASVRVRWSWRRRRFVARRKASLAALCVVVTVAGSYHSPVVYWQWRATILSGAPSLGGRISVQPPSRGGVVRAASVRLVPVGPVFGGLHRFLSPPRAVVLTPSFGGRWQASWFAAPRLRPGWSYAVVVAAERCRPVMAGLVPVGFVAARRVDTVIASCWPEPPLRRSRPLGR